MMICSMKDTELFYANEDGIGLFIPQKKESTVDVVINNIKRLLLTKQLLPGDRLPNEIELAKVLSVSRGSVREAMKILSAFGIIEVRQGDGTYIASSTKNALFEPLLFNLILTEPDIEELSEFRKIMETEVVKLAIRNANEEDIKKIETTYLKMKEKINNLEVHPAELSRCDLDFHTALGSATRNRLVERTYGFILSFFAPSIETTHENQKSGFNALHIHREILDSIIEKDIDKAVKAIEYSVIAWRNLSVVSISDSQD